MTRSFRKHRLFEILERSGHTKIGLMDGILIPVAGLFVGVSFGLFSLMVPRLRRFTAAALTAPILASVVLLVGGFILADMNPAREYGAAYILERTRA